ncbi:hypothetical protein F511_43373 [Dorcoceras hygrometricum]|uniref:Uncharacterized protein n=1 Tax=Dorcoceras hygrometricum TaxID=472368 RepID=A0A2Z7CA55_9LAMI|nr:hypothetical protein F511_43373 [Dorcoceras hygrometricum]
MKFRGDDEVCVAKSPAAEFASPNVQLLNVALLTLRLDHLTTGCISTAGLLFPQLVPKHFTLLCVASESTFVTQRLVFRTFAIQSTGNLATGLIFCLCATADIIVASGSLRPVLQLATG